MVEDVLGVTVPEMQPPEQLDDFHVHGGKPVFCTASSPSAEDGFVHFLRHLGHHFLDARRVNAAIQDQPLHGLARDFAAHGIKAGKHHRVGRVVNQHRDAGRRLEGADVAAVAADDAPLHLLAIDGDGGGGGLKGVLAGVTLDGHADDLPGLFLGAHLASSMICRDERAGVALAASCSISFRNWARASAPGELGKALQLFPPLLGQVGPSPSAGFQRLRPAFASRPFAPSSSAPPARFFPTGC